MWEYVQILLVPVSIFVVVYLYTNRKRKKKKQKLFMFVISFFLWFLLALFVFIILYLVIILIFVPNSSSGNLINLDNNCSISLISTGNYEERIYLSYGTIFTIKRDPKKEYNIVSYVIHYNFEQFARIICFDTVEDAEDAGYTESEFSKNMRENPLY